MTFGDDWGWGAPKETCKELLHVYLDAGGNFIDTANNYTNGSRRGDSWFGRSGSVR